MDFYGYKSTATAENGEKERERDEISGMQFNMCFIMHETFQK